MLFFALLVNFFIINFINAQQYIDDLCVVRATGESGRCSLLLDCPAAVADLQQQRYPQICGFQGTQPVVCCPGGNKPATTSTTTTRTTTTTTTTTTTAQNSRKPGETAKAKCKEYGKYVFRKIRPPILSLIDDIAEEEKNECGFKVGQLIVGGVKAGPKEFPHMALVGYGTAAQINWLCGGTIISDQFILTAGHCLISREVGEAKYVKIGANNLLETGDPAQIIAVQERVRHPEYFISSHYNDIGLLKLEKKAKLNPDARPACLFTETSIPTQRAIATGWGKVSYAGENSNDLLKVTLDFFTTQRCNSTFKDQRKLKRGILENTQVCAGSLDPEKEMDTCQGDSGGPLQIYHTKNDVQCMYDIVGVTSFGKACGLGAFPGVYTRVSHYIKWIEDQVWPVV